MSEPMIATEQVDAMARPFPWRCPRCHEKKVQRVTVAYQCKRSLGDQVITLSVPDLQVPKCENCGELVFDYVAEDQINQALRKLTNTATNGTPPSCLRAPGRSTTYRGGDVALGRDAFLTRLASEFPDVLSQIGPCDTGLLHCEMAVFRRATEQAIDAGRLWEAEKHFRLVEELLAGADPQLSNALEISYLEDFALGVWTPKRYEAVKERMPESMRVILARHSSKWN